RLGHRLTTASTRSPTARSIPAPRRLLRTRAEHPSWTSPRWLDRCWMGPLLRLETVTHELQGPAVLRHSPHDRVRHARGPRPPRERHRDLRSHEPSEVCGHLVRDAAGVTPHTRRAAGRARGGPALRRRVRPVGARRPQNGVAWPDPTRPTRAVYRNGYTRCARRGVSSGDLADLRGAWSRHGRCSDPGQRLAHPNEATMANDTSTTWSWSGAAMSAAGELAALAQVVCALPLRRLGAHTLGDVDDHPVPVVLVHGILGDPTNFCSLRRHLARNGIRRFSSFAYRPRLDYQRIARDLAAHIEQVRKATGAAQVDVIGHSLGGLVARYLVQTEGGRLVRRLVTLGTPYLALHNPAQELAVFGADDALV